MSNAPGTDPVPSTTGGDQIAPVAQPVTASVQPPDAPVRTTPGRAKSGGRGGVGTIVLAVGLIVAVGGVAFAVGRVTAPASSAAGTNRQFGGNAAFGANGQFPSGSFAPGALGDRAGFGGGFGGLTGTVTAIAADSITIQVGGTSGRTVTIPLASTTTYHTEQAATASDVTVGSEVTVRTQRTRITNGQGGQAQGQQGQNGQPGQLPPDQLPNGSFAPGQGGVPNFTIGPATDVTVIPKSGQ